MCVGAVRTPNKEMKLTSVEHIERSQLISSVRPTLARMEPAYGEPVGPTATAG